MNDTGWTMTDDITAILEDIQSGNENRASELLPIVYHELRALARAKLSREKPGQTLQATALVHEAYLRLVGNRNDEKWNGRGHFFGAAAEAMRRILIENARRRKAARHGGDAEHIEFSDQIAQDITDVDRILDLDVAIDQLESTNDTNARLVKLVLFTGLSIEEASAALEISTATGYRKWKYSRAFLKAALS